MIYQFLTNGNALLPTKGIRYLRCSARVVRRTRGEVGESAAISHGIRYSGTL